MENVKKGHEDAAEQIKLLQKNLNKDQQVLQNNPNGDVKITLHVKAKDIQFDSVIDQLSNVIQETYPEYTFTNNDSFFELMGIYNLWVRATPVNLVHQPLEERDYETACRSTGLTASTMRTLQNTLTLASLHGNKERWGLLKFKTEDINETGEIVLVYTTQDGSGTGVDALDKASELLPLAIDALAREDSDVSVKDTNLNELSERAASFRLVHEDSEHALLILPKLQEQLVAELGEIAELAKSSTKTEAKKLGIFGVAKRRRLLQKNAALSTQVKSLISSQHDKTAGPAAWESVVKIVNDIDGVDKKRINQLTLAYRKAFDLQHGFNEAERQSAQRLQAAGGGEAYLCMLLKA